MSRLDPFRLLTLHSALFGLAAAMAGGFVGAYLIKLGLGLPVALATYAGLLTVRCGIRLLAVEVVRRVGIAGGMKVGAALGALGFLPLLLADRSTGWLLAWVVAVSMAEALYWPAYHTATAATAAGEGSLGRQLGERMTVGALVAVAGPLVGGLLLASFGEAADFGIAAFCSLLSILPLARIGRIEGGPMPSLREALRGTDRVGVATFAADGWISSGLTFVWPMLLFSSMGANYEAFGAANAIAGLAGAAVSLFCGHAIDRGQRDRCLLLVCTALAGSFALRATSAWWPLGAVMANATGAAIMGFYGPVVMSAVYARAKRSGAIYRFQINLEAGWDCGAVAGLLVAALVAWAAPAASLAVLPAALGIIPLYWAVRGPRRVAPAPGPALIAAA
ncbi:hypothetical protein [Belnapia sp. F-4-1]|uniref:hypothetical protein n=1 Tax=Belnapia sp. F-4-1 TaxID=1545443 RepID=UPI0005BDED85|nr:hypothetical protein [Belnapia sp. F-4-1]